MKVKKQGKGGAFQKKKSRKEIRKEKRIQKKVRKNDYYTKRLKNAQPDQLDTEITKTAKNKKPQPKPNPTSADQLTTAVRKEKQEHNKLKKEIAKQRKKILLDANDDEDKNIKRLEKQLKINKLKVNKTPKSFTEDGLDYLLEVCDSENMKAAVAAEQQFAEVNDDFEEDLALMTGKNLKKRKKGEGKSNIEEDSDDGSFEDEDFGEEDSDIDVNDGFQDEESEQEVSSDEEPEEFTTNKGKRRKLPTKSSTFENINGKHNTEINDSMEEDESNSDMSSDEEAEEFTHNKGKRSKLQPKNQNKKSKIDDIEEDDFSDTEDLAEGGEANSNLHQSDADESNNEDNSNNENKASDKDEIWEDIYGRKRGKNGEILEDNNKEKYIPPAIRAKMEAESSTDKKRGEKLARLKRQLKGLLNRLAESNMHSIATQIEELYMNNSRNDMNDTLTSLILNSVVSPILTPERLLLEHVLLITILHANIGTEVGAHFLQTVATKFNELFRAASVVENKQLDNIVWVLAQLFNFKVFQVSLIYEIVAKLSERFTETDIECILLILKNVGFTMRKEDPLSLKNLIVNLQKQANTASEDLKNNPRVKFMLEILLAVKNNNMNKIPNYDTSYAEHLKKLLKNFIRKGSYVTTLNISLEDLLKADEYGKWWVVGSAWSGKTTESDQIKREVPKSEVFSQKLLDLARKQRMNTDTRRSIFCILMSSEDYLDAFEKLLHLGLKNQQEMEIIHVILHCCLQEKEFNQYYAVLAQKLCEYDRKFQITIKYSIWDKLKAISECSTIQLSNLAKLLTYLFLEKGLPISTLKIVQFGDLDKITLRFMRQILIGILLCDNDETCQNVFINIAQSEKLKLFKESLRLFIQHFLLRNLKTDVEQSKLLEKRGKMVDKILSFSSSKFRI